VRSRTLKFSPPDDPDAPDSSSSCGYDNRLLSWLTGGFTRPSKHQHSAAVSVELPHIDNDENVTEADGIPLDHPATDRNDERVQDVAVKSLFTEEHNTTMTPTSELVTASHSAVVATKLNVTYTTTAEVLSVPE